MTKNKEYAGRKEKNMKNAEQTEHVAGVFFFYIDLTTIDRNTADNVFIDA